MALVGYGKTKDWFYLFLGLMCDNTFPYGGVLFMRHRNVSTFHLAVSDTLKRTKQGEGAFTAWSEAALIGTCKQACLTTERSRKWDSRTLSNYPQSRA